MSRSSVPRLGLVKAIVPDCAPASVPGEFSRVRQGGVDVDRLERWWMTVTRTLVPLAHSCPPQTLGVVRCSRQSITVHLARLQCG